MAQSISKPWDTLKKKTKSQKVKQLYDAADYYKFSFSDNGKDVNPDSDLKKYQAPELYWSENNKLSNIELQLLKPTVVLSFNGRHNKIIKEANFNFIKVNDPSWILQGGSGVLKQNSSWDKKTDDKNINNLIDSYLEQIDGKYMGKRDAIKIYLMKYYTDWENIIKQSSQ